MIPIAGSAYTYGYATLGELVAWIIGWDLILEYLFGAATVAVGWSGYFASFLAQLGLKLPLAYTQAPLSVVGTHNLVRSALCIDPATNQAISLAAGQVCDTSRYVLSHGMINLPAIILIGLMSTLLVIGIKESARFNNVIVFLKLAIVFLVIGFGFMYVNTANWHPFIPPNTTGEFGHFGWSGIVRAAGVVFFAYIGFDAVSTAAQEAKNPQRDMPIGILASLGICTVLYILMALVMTGLGALHGPQRSAAGLRRDREAAGAGVARPIHQHRRDRRPRVGRARDAHGSAAHLLLDVARRTAAGGVRQGASASSKRRTSRRSSPASSPRWSPASSRSACSASSCRSARCSRSSSSASA